MFFEIKSNNVYTDLISLFNSIGIDIEQRKHEFPLES